jgi:hypothetical protein
MITNPPEDRGPARLTLEHRDDGLHLGTPIGLYEPDSSCRCCGRRTFATHPYCPRCGGPAILKQSHDSTPHDSVP